MKKTRVNNKPIRTRVKKVVLEAVLVAGIGMALAFVANRISPRRVVLTWNYFGGSNGSVPRSLTAVPRAGAAGTNRLAVAERLAAELKQKGLQSIDGAQALQFFHDPRFRQQQIVFIDALNDQEYKEGHIPGAFRFDPYNPAHFADYMAEVLPVCEAAQQVVVYCNGGDCDASERAAQYLVDSGLSIEKIYIYIGGIAEWKSNRLPVEIGARNAGNQRNTNP